MSCRTIATLRLMHAFREKAPWKGNFHDVIWIGYCVFRCGPYANDHEQAYILISLPPLSWPISPKLPHSSFLSQIDMLRWHFLSAPICTWETQTEHRQEVVVRRCPLISSRPWVDYGYKIMLTWVHHPLLARNGTGWGAVPQLVSCLGCWVSGYKPMNTNSDPEEDFA